MKQSIIVIKQQPHAPGRARVSTHLHSIAESQASDPADHQVRKEEGPFYMPSCLFDAPPVA